MISLAFLRPRDFIWITFNELELIENVSVEFSYLCVQLLDLFARTDIRGL